MYLWVILVMVQFWFVLLMINLLVWFLIFIYLLKVLGLLVYGLMCLIVVLLNSVIRFGLFCIIIFWLFFFGVVVGVFGGVDLVFECFVDGLGGVLVVVVEVVGDLGGDGYCGGCQRVLVEGLEFVVLVWEEGCVFVVFMGVEDGELFCFFFCVDLVEWVCGDLFFVLCVIVDVECLVVGFGWVVCEQVVQVGVD